MYVNVPWSDTTYSAGTGLSLSGTTFNHSNSVTAGTAGTLSATSSTNRTIAIPYITYDAQGHITAGGTHTHTIESFPEAYLAWGGRNFSSSYGPIDAAMIPQLGANRFAFLKAAGLDIEYSIDDGETWIDYGSTDTQKIGLFGNGQLFYLGKHIVAGSSTLEDMLRVTIATGAAGIYTTLNKIAIYMYSSGNTVQVKIEKALESTPDNYITHLDWTRISGWSGWNILNINGITTYGNSPNIQYGRIRFIFKQTAINNGSYPAANISIIMGFGGVGWTTPSNMAKNGHLYSYDNNQNTTFPAQVTATQFNGNVNGSATSLINKTLDSLTINSTAGSFTFQGSGIPWDGTDWVGLQVGSNNDKFQIHALNGTTLEYRQNNSGGTDSNWGDWYALLSSGNYTDYTVKKDGTGATGSWGISITGNAATATSATSATTASKLGSSNIGAADRPIYLSTGTATQTTYRMAATNTVASTARAITDNLETGIWYVNGTNSTDLYSQADGVAYVNKFSDSWIHEIYGDYRTGQIAVRGKNNGTWQPWRKILDSSNYTNYMGNYVTLTTEQTISGRKTFENLAAVTFKPSSGTDKCNINYDATLGALVFSF